MRVTDRYAYSFDEEHYHGEYHDPETAARQAFQEHVDDGADGRKPLTVYVGKIERQHITDHFHDRMTDSLLESLAEETGEHNGDWADGFLDDVKPEALKELHAAFALVLRGWAEKHGHTPHWYSIENAKKYEVTGGKIGEKIQAVLKD